MDSPGYAKTVWVSVAIVAIFFWIVYSAFSWGEREMFASNDGPYGFIDKNGVPAIDLSNYRPLSPITDLGPFSEGLAVVLIPGRQPGDSEFFCTYVDKTGKLLKSATKFYAARPFSEGRAAVQLKRESFWAFIDKTGKIVIKNNFEGVQDFSEGLVGVLNSSNHKWQYIDKDAKSVFNQEFDAVTPFSQGRASVRIGMKWGLIDKAGKQILAPTYRNYIHAFSDGLAAVEIPDSGQVDYLDREGKLKFSLKRTYLKCPLAQGAGPAEGQKKFADSEVNCEDTPPAFPLPNVDFSEGLVVYENNGKYGYRDLSGNTVIEPKFDYCCPFSEGLAIVQDKTSAKGLGYINRKGELVIPLSFARAYPFSEGLAAVRFSQHGRSLFIDKNGVDVFDKRPWEGIAYRLQSINARSFHEWLHTTNRGKDVSDKNTAVANPEIGVFMNAESFHDGLARVGQELIWF